MDGSRFDRITRNLASGSSRRSLMKAALGSIGGAVFASRFGADADAARRTGTSPAQLRFDVLATRFPVVRAAVAHLAATHAEQRVAPLGNPSVVTVNVATANASMRKSAVRRIRLCAMKFVSNPVSVAPMPIARVARCVRTTNASMIVFRMAPADAIRMLPAVVASARADNALPPWRGTVRHQWRPAPIHKRAAGKPVLTVACA